MFDRLLAGLNKKVAWETELAAMPAGVKPNEELHPFSPSLDRFKPKTPSGQDNLGTFIDRLNAFGKGGGL